MLYADNWSFGIIVWVWLFLSVEVNFLAEDLHIYVRVYLLVTEVLVCEPLTLVKSCFFSQEVDNISIYRLSTRNVLKAPRLSLNPSRWIALSLIWKNFLADF